VNFHRSLWTSSKFPDDEQGPLIADHLQRPGNWTAIDFASSHYLHSELLPDRLEVVTARPCDLKLFNVTQPKDIHA
jgi:hypothetical protein